jgi:hypothetical protein
MKDISVPEHAILCQRPLKGKALTQRNELLRVTRLSMTH